MAKYVLVKHVDLDLGPEDAKKALNKIDPGWKVYEEGAFVRLARLVATTLGIMKEGA